MSFRRIPFQFSSTDPVERQAELERRFGLPARNMYVDVANPLSMGSARNGFTGSPRLQHRVPMFLDGQEHPINSSVDQTSETKKTPNVRVIPIEVEGDYRPSNRHRTFSGPAGAVKGHESPLKDESCLKRSVQDLSQPSKVELNGEGPRVHRIPIQIEGQPSPPKKTLKSSIKKKEHPVVNGKQSISKSEKFHNGCTVSKEPKNVSSCENIAEQQPTPKTPEPKEENTVESSMKKIEDVLKELEAYEKGVVEFSGTLKDKQYRYLDEMLTRCMLRLDNVDTLGDSDVRSARKNAVRKVQASIDLLESKVKTEELQTSVPSETATDVDMQEAESNLDADGQHECPMTEVQNNSTAEGEAMTVTEVDHGKNSNSTAEGQAMTVTEVDPDTEVEGLTHEPDIVEPCDVEMSENKLKTDLRDSVIDEEPPIEIEEVEDGSVSNSDAPEVEMSDMESESLQMVEVSVNACCKELSEERNATLTDSNPAVTEISENESMLEENAHDTPQVDPVKGVESQNAGDVNLCEKTVQEKVPTDSTVTEL